MLRERWIVPVRTCERRDLPREIADEGRAPYGRLDQLLEQLLNHLAGTPRVVHADAMSTGDRGKVRPLQGEVLSRRLRDGSEDRHPFERRREIAPGSAPPEDYRRRVHRHHDSPP